MEFKVSYDKVADALYIKLKDKEVEDSIEVKNGVIVDIGKEGDVIGVEILEFSKKKIDINEIIAKCVESVISVKA